MDPPTRGTHKETTTRSASGSVTEAGGEREGPSTDAILELLVGNSQCDHRIHLLSALGEHLVERLRLGHRAREPIEDEAPAAVHLRDTIVDDAEDDVVRDELTRGHLCFCLHPDFGFVRDCRAEHVAGRELGNVELLDDLGRLDRDSRHTVSDHR